MKRFLFLLTILTATGNILNAQDRYIARGADFGELYMANSWYALYDLGGHPHYKDIQKAIFRVTENGKKLTIQCDASYFYSDYQTMVVPDYILADATQGVIYSCHKQAYDYTSLWVSFDYGKNWTFREEYFGRKFYYSANAEGLIYQGWEGAEILKSTDYAETFSHVEGTCWTHSEFGWDKEEVFMIGTFSGYPLKLFHSYNLFQTYTEIPIDDKFEVYDPDVYRGGLPGEVYIYSWFCEIDQHQTFRALFSADTGRTYQPVYVSEPLSPYLDFNKPKPNFMSDREPGVFYIIKNYMVEDLDDLFGWYLRPCIYYYRDYGEILEGVFCHDLVRDYEYVEIPCEHTTDLVLEMIDQNAIHLQWSNVADNIRGYHVFRNDARITKEMLIDTFYLDENLQGGEYEYYVRAYYEYDCPSDSSNHVAATIAVGIKEMRGGIVVYPNPTGGEIQVTAGANNYSPIQNIEVFDVFGRNMDIKFPSFGGVRGGNISHLPTGMYFLRITTGNGVVTRKVVKM